VLSALRVALERHVGRRARVVVEHPAVGRHLKAAGFRVVEPGGPTSPGTREGEDLADAIVLAAQEFSEAGEGAEPMLAETVARVRPGGHVIATVLNAVPRDATEQRGGRKACRPS